MSSSANQQSRVMGLRRPNKRARVEVNPVVAEAQENAARMRRDYEDTLASLVRFQEEYVRLIRINLFDEIEKLMAEDVGVVAEDGFDDSGPRQVFGAVFGYAMAHDADRRRCPCCNKFLAPDGTVMEQTSPSFSDGSVCNPISLSSDSVSRADARELEDDGASCA